MSRILIIDDDKSFREALAESVWDFGHEVVEASGAEEALGLIGNVEAALVDLKMRGPKEHRSGGQRRSDGAD
jgi:CheY-like chemotaxis protein